MQTPDSIVQKKDSSGKKEEARTAMEAGINQEVRLWLLINFVILYVNR